MSQEYQESTGEHRVWLKGDTEAIVALLTPCIALGNSAWAARIFNFNNDTKAMQVTRMQVSWPFARRLASLRESNPGLITICSRVVRLTKRKERALPSHGPSDQQAPS